MFTNVIIPILLFGALVFFHELGHFTVAKMCGVFVERFAIGFGPALFKKRWGETEYAICAFPLGGYVKMRGEEIPEGDEKPNMDPRSFAAQNVWKRIAIVIMGPVANFILPIFVFMALFLVGNPTPSTMVGYVMPNSPAESAGLLAGDKIEYIEGERIERWKDMNKIIRSRPDQETRLVVNRLGKTIEISVRPKLEDGRNEYNEPVQVGKIGIDVISYKPVIGVSDLKSEAYKAGLRTGDVVTEVNGQPIRYWWQLENAMNKLNAKKLTLMRDGKTLEFKTNADLASSGLEKGELFIKEIVEDSIAQENGLKVGDHIVSLNEKKLESWYDFRKTIMSNNGETISLGLLRDGKTVDIKIVPEEVVQRDALTQEKKKVRQLGIMSVSAAYPIDFFKERYANPFMAFARGVSETVLLTKQTFIGLWKLVTGKLSVNNMGGPISIFYMAGTSYESGGWNAFFRLMAILSITLAALNILPIPVLDGGHLFFFVIEVIKGSPVHIRVQQMAMQVGFFLLMGLMVLVFYIDINRFFVDKIKSLF